MNPPDDTSPDELRARAVVLADMIEHHLLGHPACAANAEWQSLGEQAIAILRDLQQRIETKSMASG